MMVKTKAQQALEFYKQAARVCPSPRDLHNVFFGIGGKFGQVFPTREEREALVRSPKMAEIDQIRDAIDADLADEKPAATPHKRPATKR
jgi:hypothetical protein